MAKKVIALLAVLTLVITPFFVIGEDAQAANAEQVTLDDIISSPDKYWVKGTYDESINKVTLSNNESVTEYVPLMITSSKYKVEQVVPDLNFYVPEKATIIVNDVDFKINKDMTVYGTIASIENRTFVINDATLTFEGATVGILKTEDGSPMGETIILEDGSSVVLDETTMAIDCTIVLYDANQPTEALSLYNILCDGVEFTNASTQADGFKLEATGTFSGLSTMFSDLVFKYIVAYSFNNFSFNDLTIDLNALESNFFMSNDDQIIDLTNNVEIDCNNTSVLGLLKSGSDKNQLLIFNLDNSGDVVTVKAVLDANGMTAFFSLMTMASTGIKSIDTNYRVMFLTAGEKVDLTKIAVTCESGYHFVGWYYEDHNGNMVKVLNPANYVAVGDETLYAMAEADVPAGHDYTGFFIGLIILLTLIVLAAFIGIYLKATEKSVQKTAAKKASKR